MPPRAVQTEAPRSFSGTGAPPVVVGALLSLLMSAGGCADGAAQQPPAVAPTEWRLLVRLSPAFEETRPEPAAIAESASRAAGVPAVYVASSSAAAWHALTLRCAAADCDAALQRLAADRLHFDSVERDALRRAAR